MVNQTNRLKTLDTPSSNGHSEGFTSSLRGLLCDALTLSELQCKLLLMDLREGSRGIIKPVVVLVLACCLALGCFPVALAAMAFALELTGMPLWAAFAISAAVGLAISGAAAYGGWRWLRNELHIFDRSTGELQNNVNWMKHALRDEHPRHVP